MLRIFLQGGQDFVTPDLGPGAPLPPATLWLDLLEPAPAEVALVQEALGIVLPTREEMREIEASARAYEEDGALFLTATILVHADRPPPQATEITFVLKDDRLVTLRHADPQPFRGMAARLARQAPPQASAPVLLLWLVDQITSRIADALERASIDIDSLSGEIFGAARISHPKERPDLLQAVERVGRNGDAAARARECLLTLTRLMRSLATSELLTPQARKETRQRAKSISRDVASLTDHATFLSGKISLLLDATLGMINIEQTNIIKIFSVLSIVMLPPTLIASIYGMNFDAMPELHTSFGYPLSLVLMVLSAVLPFWYFRRRGWL
ncbi:MAG: magnesium transporter CorA family protein [Geminicoccaceae bacterium]